jgi:hypothetical protein
MSTVFKDSFFQTAWEMRIHAVLSSGQGAD